MSKKAKRKRLTDDQRRQLRAVRRVHRKLVPRAVQAAMSRVALTPDILIRSSRLQAAMHHTIATVASSMSIEQMCLRILDNEDSDVLAIVHSCFVFAEDRVREGSDTARAIPPKIVRPMEDREAAVQMVRWFASLATSPDEPPDPDRRIQRKSARAA